MKMNSSSPRNTLETLLSGGRPDRVLFCPAIYEHKARLIEKTPSEVATNADLLVQATLTEYETYRPDTLTVGIDVYNIEAEALGCVVQYPPERDAVPVIVRNRIHSSEQCSELSVPAPRQDARLPLILEATRRVHEAVGKDVFVRGAITGPFSLACKLMGVEPLLMECVSNPKGITPLLDFCTNVSIAFGRALLEQGTDICVFDSHATPPLISPPIFRDSVLPQIQRLMKDLKEHGASFVEYVVGGDTAPMANDLADCGAEIILADFKANLEPFLACLKQRQILIRRNLDPANIEIHAPASWEQELRPVVRLAADDSRWIVGTGVISYNTPFAHLQQVRQMCMDMYAEAQRD